MYKKQICIRNSHDYALERVCKSIETTLNDLVNFIDKTKHSRIPVFENNLDKVLGMIHIRDLFEKIHQRNTKKKVLRLQKR